MTPPYRIEKSASTGCEIYDANNILICVATEESYAQTILTALNQGTKPVFTTGEAAKIAKLSQQTIIRACKTGLLKSFKVPGSTHRRILRSDFDTFLKIHNIPAEADL